VARKKCGDSPPPFKNEMCSELSEMARTLIKKISKKFPPPPSRRRRQDDDKEDVDDDKEDVDDDLDNEVDGVDDDDDDNDDNDGHFFENKMKSVQNYLKWREMLSYKNSFFLAVWRGGI
jgi:hypothetical protein